MPLNRDLFIFVTFIDKIQKSPKMPNKEIVYHKIGLSSLEEKINIIHFNDVYNIEEGSIEPIAGAARFVNLLENILKSNETTLVLFSGDAISPSNCE